MNRPNKNPTIEGYYYLPVFLMLNLMLSLFVTTTVSPLRHLANIVKSIKKTPTKPMVTSKKKQTYAECFCPHQVQDITGKLMLPYWILNLRRTIILQSSKKRLAIVYSSWFIHQRTP